MQALIRNSMERKLDFPVFHVTVFGNSCRGPCLSAGKRIPRNHVFFLEHQSQIRRKKQWQQK